MAKHDLNAPARLLWWPTTPKSEAAWKTAQTYPSLRRAVTEAMTNAPEGQIAWILTEAGGTLKRRVALDLENPFDRYVFIEKDPKRIAELEGLKVEYEGRRLIEV